MNILFISHLRLYPIRWGSEKRVIQLIEWLLIEGHDVIYLHYGNDVLSEADISKLPGNLIYIEAATARYQFFYFTKDAIRNIVQRLIPSIPRKVVTNPNKLWHPEIGAHISRVVAQYNPEVAILEYLWTTPATKFLPPYTLKIVDTHDVFSRKKELYDAGVDPFFYCSESAEREWLLPSDVIMAIQEEEASWFRSLIPERTVITVLPPAKVVSVSSPGIEPKVLFVGSAWPANVHGITQFAMHCWPKVLAELPGVRLRIVGNVTTKLSNEIPSCDRIGAVSDLADEYKQAMIVINPVSLGTGVQVKSIEALCHGKVLVSTSKGIVGIPRGDEEAYIVSDDWNHMAEMICRLMVEETTRQRIASAALNLARRKLSVQNAFRELQTILENKRTNLEMSSSQK